MTRPAIAVLVLLGLASLAGCFRDHPSGQQELMGSDCYSCHATDYTGTTAPVHRDAPQVFSTACASCHRTLGWQPALEGLHSDVFGIVSGAHAQIACLGCHDLASGQSSHLGANTNCIQCHPDDATQREGHVGVTTLTSEPTSPASACSATPRVLPISTPITSSPAPVITRCRASNATTAPQASTPRAAT